MNRLFSAIGNCLKYHLYKRPRKWVRDWTRDWDENPDLIMPDSNPGAAYEQDKEPEQCSKKQ